MLAKKESLQLKGVAILIMIFLHLFNQMGNVDKCITFFEFYNEPIVSQLSKFCQICVGLYLFMSGYGLYISYSKNHHIKPFKRILKLYIIFWTVFLFFISIGTYLHPSIYPGNFSTFISNITGWNTIHYNGEWWFLFPYVLLVLTANQIFRIIRKLNFISLVILIGLTFCVSYLTIWVNRDYLYSHQFAYMPILYCSCIPAFALGALFVKYDIVEKVRKVVTIKSVFSQVIWSLLLIVLLAIRALCPLNAVNIIVMPLFVCWFAVIPKSQFIGTLLEKLGGQSTNMWLIHTFFCYYLFSDFIYGFKYPIFIFAVTVLLSYVSGVLIEKVYSPLLKRI